jgi:hypothetical protein
MEMFEGHPEDAAFHPQKDGVENESSQGKTPAANIPSSPWDRYDLDSVNRWISEGNPNCQDQE